MHTWFSQSQSKLLINLYLTPIFYFLQSIFYLRLQPFRNHYLRKLSAFDLFANQKRDKTGVGASNLAQTLAPINAGAALKSASCQSGGRTFLTKLASKGTAIHIWKKLLVSVEVLVLLLLNCIAAQVNWRWQLNWHDQKNTKVTNLLIKIKIL